MAEDRREPPRSPRGDIPRRPSAARYNPDRASDEADRADYSRGRQLPPGARSASVGGRSDSLSVPGRKYENGPSRHGGSRPVQPASVPYPSGPRGGEPRTPQRPRDDRPLHISHALAGNVSSNKGVTSPPLWITVSALLLFTAIILTIKSYQLPFVGPAIGFWFLMLHPTYLLFTTRIWRTPHALERLGYSLAAVLLILMFGGLAINTALPPLGLERPLGPIPIAILGDILNVSLYVLRQRRPATIRWRASLKACRPPELRMVIAAAVAPILAILGANTLNNGAGDQVSVLALVWIATTVSVLILIRRQLRDPIIGAAIFFVALALLLMTSLRGWVLTGHDIQTEYRVFQLTEVHARWTFAAFPNAYNACVSLTILPTEIARTVNIDSSYVYRFFYQVLFAVCPVLAYAIFRRYAPKGISLLATVYFIGFPTFFSDMPLSLIHI